MKKTLVLLFAIISSINLMADDVYTVVGGLSDNFGSGVFGTRWDLNNTSNDMTFYQDDMWILVKDVTSDQWGQSIEFKVVKNRAYDGEGHGQWPLSSNQTFTIPEGKTKLYFVLSLYDKRKETYAFTDFVLAGDTQIAKTNNWSYNEDANILTTEDGNIFTITKHDVIASNKDKTFNYKVVGKGGWAFEVPGNDRSQSLTLAERGSYDVTFTFNFSEKTLTADAVKQPTQYYIYGGHTNDYHSWSILGKMTQNGENWEYDYTYNSTNGENDIDTYFIAPDYVIDKNGGFTFEWGALYRPEDGGTQIEGFAAGSGSTVNGGDNKWVIKGNYPNHIVFNPNSKTWSSTAYIAKAVANNEKKLGTFSAAGNVAIPEGVTAYIGKLSAGGAGIDMVEVTDGVIPANTGVLYTSTANAGTNLKFCATNTATSFDTTGNVLQGTGAASTTLADGDYVLARVRGENLAFYPVEGTPNYGPFKAYIPKGTVGSAAKLAINFGDETGIATLSHEKTDNVYYDLQGRRVVNPTKGLFIVNGKKVIR